MTLARESRGKMSDSPAFRGVGCSHSRCDLALQLPHLFCMGLQDRQRGHVGVINSVETPRLARRIARRENLRYPGNVVADAVRFPSPRPEVGSRNRRTRSRCIVHQGGNEPEVFVPCFRRGPRLDGSCIPAQAILFKDDGLPELRREVKVPKDVHAASFPGLRKRLQSPLWIEPPPVVRPHMECQVIDSGNAMRLQKILFRVQTPHAAFASGRDKVVSIQFMDVCGSRSDPFQEVAEVPPATGAWQAGAFLVVSVSAYYLLRRRHTAFAQASMKVGLGVALVASLHAVRALGDACGRWARSWIGAAA